MALKCSLKVGELREAVRDMFCYLPLAVEEFENGA